MTPFFIHLFRTIKIPVVERYLNQNISMAFEWGKKCPNVITCYKISDHIYVVFAGGWFMKVQVGDLHTE